MALDNFTENKNDEKVCDSHFKFSFSYIKNKAKFKNMNTALKISAVYGFIGMISMEIFNKLAYYIVKDKVALSHINIIKDFIFILISAVFLYILVSLMLRNLRLSKKQFNKKYNELVSSYKKLENIEEKLRYNVYHDTLTGLPNKFVLKDRIVRQQENDGFGRKYIFVIDFDNFKYINDVFGHSLGDQVIIEVSKRLNSIVGQNFTLYRFGGDEFIVLQENVVDISEVKKLANKVIETMKSSVEIGDNSIAVAASIGISVYPDNGKNLDELLKKAGIAMYSAKKEGRNKFVLYDEYMNESLKNRMRIEKCLRTALDNNEFVLYYQPQLNIETREISGFEALLRWKNPKLGFVSPNDFISIAEDINLIVPLGEWVLKNSCALIKQINDKYKKEYVISVNISILQLFQDDFVDTVNDILKKVGLKPQYLELEITESILMESFESISEKLDLLRKNGVKIALDDFGKGYSSFNYLKQLPITTLKIDKTFIDNITIDSKSSFIADSIVSIGRKIGLSVIAEGVELQEQLDCLTEYKCDKIQGYLFSKPLPENEMKELILSYN